MRYGIRFPRRCERKKESCLKQKSVPPADIIPRNVREATLGYPRFMSPRFLFLYGGYNTDRLFPPSPRTYPTCFRVGVRAFMDIHLSFAANSACERATRARTTISLKQLSIANLIKHLHDPGARETCVCVCMCGYHITPANSHNVANQRWTRWERENRLESRTTMEKQVSKREREREKAWQHSWRASKSGHLFRILHGKNVWDIPMK